MKLTATIEMEIDVRELISVFEENTKKALCLDNFEHFYNYWRVNFVIYATEMRLTVWEQNREQIQKEYNSIVKERG